MEKTLDFKVLFYMLRTKIIWIIVAAVIGALSAFAISSFLLEEQYASETKVYISNQQEPQDYNKVNTSDLSASRSMASTYRIILASKRATDLLKSELLADERFVKASTHSYRVTISVVDNSEVLTIRATSPDPNVAAIVCNKMVDVSAALISDIFESGRSNSLGEAVANYVPTSPNTRMNMLVGIAAGVMFSCAIIILGFFMDNRVKDEADFVQKVGIPVLGEVPSMHEETPKKQRRKKKKGYGYYYAYNKKSNG